MMQKLLWFLTKKITISFALLIVIFVANINTSKNTTHIVYAQSNIQKDSDLDGISDEAEKKYGTNPNSPDTDNDKILDTQEIMNGTNPSDPASSKTNIDQAFISANDPIMWYIARISGIASFIMFTLVICLGLLMTSKAVLKLPFLHAPQALQLHTFNASIIALFLMVIHFGSLIFDSYFKIQWYEILIPFTLSRDIKSALEFDFKIPVALGVISMYLAFILVVTSKLRRKVFSLKTWRTIHYASFLFYLLFLIHAIMSGTDSKEIWMLAIYIISIVCVSGLILLRIFGKKYFLPSTPKPVINN